MLAEEHAHRGLGRGDAEDSGADARIGQARIGHAGDQYNRIGPGRIDRHGVEGTRCAGMADNRAQRYGRGLDVCGAGRWCNERRES